MSDARPLEILQATFLYKVHFHHNEKGMLVFQGRYFTPEEAIMEAAKRGHWAYEIKALEILIWNPMFNDFVPFCGEDWDDPVQQVIGQSQQVSLIQIVKDEISSIKLEIDALEARHSNSISLWVLAEQQMVLENVLSKMLVALMGEDN